MSEFKLTTVEEFEEATARLLETGAKVGADAWQLRVKKQTPHCKFGEQGVCCRICAMGPCRITPKAPRGICGCDVHGIVGRNFLKFTAGGAATHSDHGREICHTLYCAKDGGNYQVKDPEKLIRIAKEWGVETEGKDIYDLAHEMAETGLMEYGKPFGYQRFLDRMPAGQKEKLIENEIAPRAIDLLLRFLIIVCIKHRQQPVSVTFSIFLQHSYSSICTSFLSRYMFAYSYQNISHKYQLYRLRYPHMAVLMFRCLPHTKYLLMFHLSVLYLLHLHSPSVG